MGPDEIMVFGGSGSRKLAERICKYLGVPVRAERGAALSEGNLFVRILENVRGRSVYIVQSTFIPDQRQLHGAAVLDRRAQARQRPAVTAVMPFFSYAKGDKKDEPRVSIRARVCADAIEAAGADRVLTMDLHAPQIQGFFKIPVDHLYAMPVLCERIRAAGEDEQVVVAPDVGFGKQARKYGTLPWRRRWR